MSAPLQYHQAVFDLLFRPPVVSAESVRRIEEHERHCPLQVPPAVREWYSLEGAEEMLTEPRLGCSPVPLATLLEQLANPEPGLRRVIPAVHQALTRPIHAVVHFYDCPGSGYTAGLLLDGRDDPLILDHRRWNDEREYETFSQFVRRTVWYDLTHGKAVSAWAYWEAAVFGLPQLDFLLEHLREHPDGYLDVRGNGVSAPVTRSYRFYDRGCRVAVETRGDPTHEVAPAWWEVHGDTLADLEAVTRRLLGCGGFGVEALYSETNDEQSVEELKRRLRGE